MIAPLMTDVICEVGIVPDGGPKVTASLNRGEEFKTHFRGALRNGCTRDELRETLIQIAVYAGIPAGVEAFRIARKVLAEQPQAS